MNVNTKAKPVEFIGENGEKLQLSASNMGEPYRDGIDLSVTVDNDYFSAFFEVEEARRLRDFLNDYLDVDKLK